jgi:hypothetical protein
VLSYSTSQNTPNPSAAVRKEKRSNAAAAYVNEAFSYLTQNNIV